MTDFAIFGECDQEGSSVTRLQVYGDVFDYLSFSTMHCGSDATLTGHIDRGAKFRFWQNRALKVGASTVCDLDASQDAL